jgi:hypothetical protein
MNARIKQVVFAVAFLLLLLQNVILVRRGREAEQKMGELEQQIKRLEQLVSEQRVP